MKGIERIDGDISDFKQVASAIHSFKPTHILHLGTISSSIFTQLQQAAMQVPGCRADPVRGGMVNVGGTLNVFEAVKKFNENTSEKVKSIVYASRYQIFINTYCIQCIKVQQLLDFQRITKHQL